MLLVAKLDRRDRQLALFLDVGLVGTVDHNVGDGGIVQQLLERPQAKQLIDKDLFERELLAPVEREFQLGEHFTDDRTELFGQLVLVERRGCLGIDPLEQAGEHLFLDFVYARLEPFGLRLNLHFRHVRDSTAASSHRAMPMALPSRDR